MIFQKQRKLAILGGTPIRQTFLPYAKQYIDVDDINAVTDVLRGHFLTTGPMAEQFEQEIATMVGARYAVAVANGTAALHAACCAAGIAPGDEVITTPLTFAASANCVLYFGAKPVFADIDPGTYNIDQTDIVRKITSRTRAIIPVHYTGQAVDLDPIHALAKKHGLIVIEDAAHALGTRYKGQAIGGLSEMTTFSFHPVKTITTGEGGMVVTNSESYYKALVMFRSHGITRIEEWLEHTDCGGGWYYEQQHLGYNYRITDIQCALGISQFRKLPLFIQRRKEIVQRYNEAFSELDGLILQQTPHFSDTAQHLYVIQLDLERLTADRRTIYEAIKAENVGVNVHYIPVYYHPYYEKLGYNRGLCPIAEHLYDRLITIPLFPAMTDADIEDVISAVTDVITYFKR
jgi:UDP-4-amino-4,6-dideoxy-N-acetyl-beta-L-altrosamine transaminase